MGHFISEDSYGFAAGDVNFYAYALGNPVSYSDPSGHIVPVLVGIWALIEIGLSIYDAYDTGKTLMDPCAGTDEKVASAGMFVAGFFLPGGAYGPAVKEGRRTLVHFGHAGITSSNQLLGSTGTKHARFGDGQCFTNLTPERIGASTKAGLSAEQIAAGQISMGQASSLLYGAPWNSRKMSHFVEIDVTGLNVLNPRPGTYPLPSNTPLDVFGRIVRSGSTR